MDPKISLNNSKLGLIPSISVPPIVTCRANCPCSKKCYALKGRFRYKTVKAAHIHNYELYNIAPDEYFEGVLRFINNPVLSYKYFRWHVAGDIIDDNYFKGMVDVAKKSPNTSFLCFTKKYEIVNSYMLNRDIPANLHIVYSYWGSDLIIDNPYNFPTAHIRFSDEQKNTTIPPDAVECSGNCIQCLECWSIKNGEAVVFKEH